MDESRARFYSLLQELMVTDERLFLLLADIGPFQARHIAAEFPERYANIGISEQAMVGAAAGLAKRGYIPVMFTWSPFLVERTYEQIKVDLANAGLPAIFVSVGGSYDYGRMGPTHHCPADVGILYNIPGMNIVLPGGPHEFERLFRQAVGKPGLYYFRLSYRGNPVEHDVTLGKMVVVRTGPGEAIVLAVGDSLPRVTQALDDQPVTILYVSSVRPFDAEMLGAYAYQIPGYEPIKILVVEPYFSVLPLLVAETLKFPVQIRSLAVPRTVQNEPGTVDEIEKRIGLDVEGIRKAFEELANG